MVVGIRSVYIILNTTFVYYSKHRLAIRKIYSGSCFGILWIAHQKYTLDSILSVRSINHSDGSNGKTGAEATTEVTYVGSPAPQAAARLAVRNCNDSGMPPPPINNKMPAEIDQTWPVSPITIYGPTQRRKDCDSPVVIQCHT